MNPIPHNAEVVPQLKEAILREPELALALLEGTDGQAEPRPATILTAAKAAAAELPQYADLHYVAAAAAQRVGRLSEAQALLEQAVELNPQYVDALILSAKVWAGLRKPRQAIAMLNQALATGGDYPDVHAMLGDSWRGLGEVEQARRSYQRALSRNPHLGIALEALAPQRVEREER